jgi:hypothetical protein
MKSGPRAHRLPRADDHDQAEPHAVDILDGCGYPPQMIRSTRLVDLVNTMDPKLVAAAFGMDPQATLIYLAHRVDEGRLPALEPGRK